MIKGVDQERLSLPLSTALGSYILPTPIVWYPLFLKCSGSVNTSGFTSLIFVFKSQTLVLSGLSPVKKLTLDAAQIAS